MVEPQGIFKIVQLSKIVLSIEKYRWIIYFKKYINVIEAIYILK